MISPTVTTETVTTKIYSIPSPATWKDVSDVMFQIRRDPDLEDASFDDAVMVSAYDDEIRFTFSIKKRRSLQSPKKDYSAEIADLDLLARTRNLLQREGVVTVNDLLHNWSWARLAGLRNWEHRNTEDLRARLNILGLTLLPQVDTQQLTE